ncbi:MAG TPA: PaaX family transcriptional regulator C-terminal domain-containing protein [Chthoniobacterales bacterium]
MGESDSDIVAAAWDFDAINRRYQRHLKILTDTPLGRVRSHSEATALRRWATAERVAWSSAVKIDPLLPRKLLPRDFGMKAES